MMNEGRELSLYVEVFTLGQLRNLYKRKESLDNLTIKNKYEKTMNKL